MLRNFRYLKEREKMPPKSMFTKDEIIDAALCVIRENGVSALTARALAAKLGCSVKPIFGLFKNMDEVQQEVIKAADCLYQKKMVQEISEKRYPPYKAVGISYIRFAKDEKNLFKLLYMRDRSNEEKAEGEETQKLIELIQKTTGLDKKTAYLFHLETWIYIHGIATMIATDYLDWDMEFVSNSITDCYIGLKYRFIKEGKINESN